MQTCPEVAARWNENNELDLDWLKQHSYDCPICQVIIGKISDMMSEEDDKEEAEE